MIRLPLPKTINRMSFLRILTVTTCAGLLLLALSQKAFLVR